MIALPQINQKILMKEEKKPRQLFIRYLLLDGWERPIHTIQQDGWAILCLTMIMENFIFSFYMMLLQNLQERDFILFISLKAPTLLTFHIKARSEERRVGKD